ncbi:MAG: hypothetical protein J3Q66DRAFT_347813 [Benniella sp.]|nr:MAG: hypothetical protein J3Q66DRAFT_347813 [Benniella sp.]
MVVRTRISARLQPVAATLAAAPASTSQPPSRRTPSATSTSVPPSSSKSSTGRTKTKANAGERTAQATTSKASVTSVEAEAEAAYPETTTSYTSSKQRRGPTESPSEGWDGPPFKRCKQTHDNKVPSQVYTKTERRPETPEIKEELQELAVGDFEEEALQEEEVAQEELQEDVLEDELEDGQEDVQGDRQEDQELVVDKVEPIQERLIRCRIKNPMELHEIRINVARFLSRRDLRSCILVCEDWWQSFIPFLWRDLRPVYNSVLGNTNDYPQPKLMRKYGHYIRTFEYNGHTSVLQSMLAPDRYYNEPEFEGPLPLQNEADEQGWLYADEDVDADAGLALEESLSDFEERIERNRRVRLEKKEQTMLAKAANQRQNKISRFLNDNTDYRKRVCDHIERIIVTDKRSSRERGYHCRNWMRLIQVNQAHLRCLELTFMIRAPEVYRDLFTQLVTMEKLEELVLFGNDIETSKMKQFIETICMRLTRLELKHMRVDYDPLTNQYGQYVNNNPLPHLPGLKILSLFKISELSNPFVWKFIARCPNVTEFVFHAQWAADIKDFSRILTKKMSKVTHLGFWTPHVTDMDMSTIFKALPTIERLDIAACRFGLMATNHLSTKHPFTITYLDIRNCSQVTGAMIVRILGECRNLRTFMADCISAKDMVYNSLYQTWACIGLRELVIDIRGSPSDEVICRKVYQRLAELTCLEHLDISRTPGQSPSCPMIDGGYSNCVTLGLSSGLGELRTLVHMKRLVYRGIVHCDVGLAELIWMVKAWPLLGEIGGKLRPRKLGPFNPNINPKAHLEEQRADEQAASSSGDSSVPLATTTGAQALDASSTQPGTSAAGSTSTSAARPIHNPTQPQRPLQKTLSEQIPRLMAMELRRLKLNHRIKVIPHSEDKPTPEQRRRFRHLLNDSDEDEPGRFNHYPYRHDWW